MPISLEQTRLSLTWTQSFLDLLADGGPAGAPMGFLGRASTYATKFAALPDRETEGADLMRPWPRPSGQNFWTYYLTGQVPGEMSGSDAWRRSVPFRARVPARLSSDALRRKVQLEAFYYPFGVSLVASVTFEEPLELTAAVQKAFDVRRTMPFDVQWDASTGLAAERVNLAQFAEAALALLRRAAIGKPVAPAARSVEPFSVVTVIAATGVSAADTVADGGELHRALEAMTSWRPGWQVDALPTLKDAALKTRGPEGIDTLYARPRGRAVWFGRLLDKTTTGGHALSCYHRNLTLLSTQVEALGMFARATSATLDGAGVLSAAHTECARQAAGLLGRLYGGKTDIYQSHSPRRQIDQNSLVEPINKVRDVFNWAALS